MSKLPKSLQITCLLGVLLAGSAGVACASYLVPTQTAVPGSCIPQFVTELPVFGPAGPIPRVNALQHQALTVKMKEIDQQVLPQGTFPCPPLGQDATVTFGPTRVWTYETSDLLTNKVLGPAHWPAVTLETRRNVPTTVQYVNELPAFNFGNPFGPGLVQGLVSVDQTIHWANPNSLHCMMEGMMKDCTLEENRTDPCCQPFTGPPPAVVHLHGGEVPSEFDGGPEQWFTPDGKKGNDYRTIGNPGNGRAIYSYPNSQEPGTPWFHDHALGATRTNVYSGLAGFYFIRDPQNEPANLPSGKYEMEMAFQDRQFDTTGQLFFPDGTNPDSNLNGPPPNPDIHPFWIPEFVGDVAIVNGVPWPYKILEPRRYRFRVVDGSNARFYNLNFGAPVYQIGADDAYIDRPVQVNTVFLAPGERADIIVDFSAFAGQTLTVTNDAGVPFPDGPVLDTMMNIMQFRVSAAPVVDTSCNPAIGQCARPRAVVRLTDGNGHLAAGVKVDKVRQLVLKEVQGPGGPIEVLVNNTKWDGLKSPGIAEVFPTDGVSELPRVGSIEQWEIINLTMDAHPMHTHLTQFQILNREFFDTDGTQGSNIPGGYPAAWENAFGTGPALPSNCLPHQFCPGFGPPLRYDVPNADGALGGNPAVSPFLLGNPASPSPEESSWKDTAKVMPGQVMRILVRWTPTSTPLTQNKSLAGFNMYPFDPTKGPGYVWHCHIVDHEDNEMMRRYKVTK